MKRLAQLSVISVCTMALLSSCSATFSYFSRIEMGQTAPGEHQMKVKTPGHPDPIAK